MDLTEAIFSRRAVRAYQPRPVPEEDVRALLRAAVQAPSAVNGQPWIFAVVQRPSTLKRWSDRAKSMMLAEPFPHGHAVHLADQLRSDAFNVFYDASTLVVIGAESHGTYTDADCWLAAENLILAACNAGLATCPIGFALPVLNTPEVKAEIHWAPAGVVVAAVIVGYPSHDVPSVARKEPRVAAWIHST